MRTISGKRTLLSTFALMALIASGNATLADAPVSSAFSISRALEQLASPDYADRRKAMRAVESYLAAQDAEWLNTQDGEAQEQVAGALQFNRQLTSWLLELNKSPEAQKREGLKFLTGPEAAPLLGQLFSEDAEVRIQGVRKLADIPSAGADLLLAHFLRDDALTVSLATMEVLWDRTPSEDVTRALWDLGVGKEMDAVLRPVPVSRLTKQVTFRGQPLLAPANGGVSVMFAAGGQGNLDAVAAQELLIHWKTPQVEALLNGSVNALVDKFKSPDGGGELGNGFLGKQSLRSVLTTLSALGDGCKFKSTIPTFFALAIVPMTDDRVLSLRVMGAPQSYYTVRTSALATVLLLTDQNPIEYGMVTGKQSSGLWECPNKDAEEAAVEKLKTWWKRRAANSTAASQ